MLGNGCLCPPAPPPNSYADVLDLNVTVAGKEDSGRWVGLTEVMEGVSRGGMGDLVRK